MTDTPRINVGAFIWALVTVPLLVILASLAAAIATGAIGLPILPIFLLVPAVGAVLSLPTYLTFGSVAYLRSLKAASPQLSTFAWNGLLAHAASVPIVALCIWLVDQHDAIERIVWFATLGTFFAPAQSALFGKLYRYFSTSIPQTPVSRRHPNRSETA